MKIGKHTFDVRDAVWFIVCLIITICFLIGYYVFDSDNLSLVLSSASTAISIVLSIVAILYTMIEGSNSSKLNEDTSNKISDIDRKLLDITSKLTKLKQLDNYIRTAAPKLDMAVKKIEQNSQSEEPLDDEVKQNIQFLLKYIDEDMAE